MKLKRLVYRSCRYWRCYLLLVFASMLSFVLIYLSQNDPKLENYFPYFGVGSQYYNFYANGGIEKMRDLMDSNHRLDYEFINTNSKFCFSKSNSGEEDFEILNGMRDDVDSDDMAEFESNEKLNETQWNGNRKPLNDRDDDSSSSSLEYIFLVIGEAGHFKHRNAIRSTWAKMLAKYNSKLVFVIGNPYFNLTQRNIRRDGNNQLVYVADHAHVVRLEFGLEEKLRLEAELRDHDDMVQIDMSDHDNYTSSKTIVALRWAITFCTSARRVFVLSDLAVLNLKQFDKLFKQQQQQQNTNDAISSSRGVITGHCSYSDDKFALALKLFFNELYKANKKKKDTKSPSLASRQLLSAATSDQDSTASATKSSLSSLKQFKRQQPQQQQESESKLTSSSSNNNNNNNNKSNSIAKSLAASSSSTTNTGGGGAGGYQGQYCSNLGWILDQRAAKRLWSTALRTAYMMKHSPAYLTGYLVFKSRVQVDDSDAFRTIDFASSKQNCLEMFESSSSSYSDFLLCPENFTISSRYTSYIATWNLGQKFAIN